MGKQRKFKKGVVDKLKVLVSKEDAILINSYLNKTEFQYTFDEENFDYCDFEEISHTLGQEMSQTFLNNLNQNKSNDFRTADFECAKLLYENLNITPRQASDIDFWNYLHHYDMYPYIHMRWNEIDSPSRTSQKNYILSHWLMHLSSQKSLIVYPLTTLWWSFHLTKDESREDPYELTRIYFKNNRYRTVTYGGSSYVRHKEAILGILEFMRENDIPETKENGDNISKYVNLLGGSKPLSFFDRYWFKEQLTSKFKHLIGHPTDLDKPIINEIFEDEKPITYFFPNPSQNELVIRYFNLYFDEHFSFYLTKSPKNSANIIIPITKDEENGELLMFYENGKINKVQIRHLLKIKIDKQYSNGQNRDQILNKIEIIKEPCIFGMTYKKGKKNYFKAHLTEGLKADNDSLLLQGKKVLYESDYTEVKYKVLPLALKDKLGTLVYSSFIAGGKALDNIYYRDQWHALSNYWPQLFLE